MPNKISGGGSGGGGGGGGGGGVRWCAKHRPRAEAPSGGPAGGPTGTPLPPQEGGKPVLIMPASDHNKIEKAAFQLAKV